ncbi:hypothetical protein DITRI_Ditri01bG0062100 [Diplodiscus trichospermus]
MAVRRGRSPTPTLTSLFSTVRLSSSHFTFDCHFGRTQILTLNAKCLSTSAIPNEYQRRPPQHNQYQPPPPSSDPRVFNGQWNSNVNNQFIPQNQGYHHPQQRRGGPVNNQFDYQIQERGFPNQGQSYPNQGQGYPQRQSPNHWNPQQNRSFPPYQNADQINTQMPRSPNQWNNQNQGYPQGRNFNESAPTEPKP